MNMSTLDRSNTLASPTTNQIRSFFYCHFRKVLNFFSSSSSLLNRKIYGLAPNGLLVGRLAFKIGKKKFKPRCFVTNYIYWRRKLYDIWFYLNAIESISLLQPIVYIFHRISLILCLFVTLPLALSIKMNTSIGVCTRIFGKTNKHQISNGTAIPKKNTYKICLIRLTIVLSE